MLAGGTTNWPALECALGFGKEGMALGGSRHNEIAYCLDVIGVWLLLCTRSGEVCPLAASTELAMVGCSTAVVAG